MDFTDLLTLGKVKKFFFKIAFYVYKHCIFFKGCFVTFEK